MVVRCRGHSARADCGRMSGSIRQDASRNFDDVETDFYDLLHMRPRQFVYTYPNMTLQAQDQDMSHSLK